MPKKITQVQWEAYGLPYGLEINPETGVISGTTPPEAAGEYDASVHVTTNYGDAWEDISINVKSAVSIITSSLPAADIHYDYSYQMKRTGNTQVRWEASGLPFGLNIDEDTGIISGQPYEEFAEDKEYDVTIALRSSFGIVLAERQYKLLVRGMYPHFSTGDTTGKIEIEFDVIRSHNQLDGSYQPNIYYIRTPKTVSSRYSSFVVRHSQEYPVDFSFTCSGYYSVVCSTTLYDENGEKYWIISKGNRAIYEVRIAVHDKDTIIFTVTSTGTQIDIYNNPNGATFPEKAYLTEYYSYLTITTKWGSMRIDTPLVHEF